MDHLDALRLFVRVVERGSFTAAAADLGLSRSTATEAVRRLETRLGARLLERTTRHVSSTPDGHAFYARCVAILADMEDAEAVLRDADPRGRLRIDASPLLTRTFLLPRLPAFTLRYPRLDIQFGQSDRLVDLVREGIDCAIRAGEPADSDLLIRPLGRLVEITVASPAYLDRFGTPARLDDLDGHQVVGFLSSRTGEVMPLEFTDGERVIEVQLKARVSANNSDTAGELALLGFGLAQAPRYRFADDIAAGRLVEVLPAHRPLPMPLSALYPRGRQFAPRLRVFLDWVSATFAASGL
ncbi:LysR family transcriptional regulator [Breoghania corrubedonensis]|uniref:LysR family transcriptional regulator n=1 Tax=Breoghania corrubedonensis TaxID=665038 RepID=A0A2T5VCU4_9HYPH|nr:LysR family transcriptional regulator [Breoghania corrubedonensis]PTW61555.1 LysR family transcriptional regulator [Breoghania corrubedonensis]